ncbi:MAG: hypothetical protein IJE05_07045 [Clostridia bacterium]|nr:hypothetical protein [Clostridia bacterium]
MQVSEKVKIRDIFASLKDIFLKDGSNENQENLEQELKKIYKVQSELGVTGDIAKLEKDVQTHTISEKSKKNKNESRISTKKVIIEEENEIDENTLDQENSLDR